MIDEHFTYLIFFASANIFSMNIPYPLVGSFTKTCVTAPTIRPFCRMGEPDTTVVNMGQQILWKFSNNTPCQEITN